MAAAFIGAFMAFMVFAFMTTFDGFLCFIARRRFMAFIGASSAWAAAFFMARRFMLGSLPWKPSVEKSMS